MTAIGDAVRRVEDPPLVTGSAHYTDDLAIPGAVHAVFVRSTLAHARIGGIDSAAAAAAPGVIAVLTAAELDLQPMPPSAGPPVFARPPLAREVVRFMGEAVAVVVASSREQALDAAELVDVDYEPLDVVVDPLGAAAPGAPLLFPDHGSNVILESPWTGEAARPESCEVVVRAHLVNQRVAPAPMEPNVAAAAPNPENGGITVWVPTQAPFWTRGALAGALKLEPERVRVTVPAGRGALRRPPFSP